MKVLIVHMRYHPDPTGTAPLVTQLAEGLAARGINVVVIASLPHYGRTSIHPDFRDVSGLVSRSMENGVEVIRTRVFIPRKNCFWQRALNYLSYTVNSFFAGFLVKEVDVVLAVNPPITTAFSAWLISLLKRTDMLLSIQDIWPDCIIEVGALSNRWLIGFSRWLEKVQYALSKEVIVLSDGMKENLLKKNVPAQKLVVIPNWADPEEVIPLPKENEFTDQHQLQEKFVVLFSGNHGHIAALEHVVESARMLRSHRDILFLLAGEGSVKGRILKQAEQAQLDNILFLPTQPKQQWLEMLAASDLGLVTLRRDLGSLNVPSKVYTLLSAELPILASVPGSSEVARIIRMAKCGFITEPEDPKALAEAILEAKKHPDLASLGERGRAHLMRSYPKKAQIEKYISQLSEFGTRD